MLSAVCLFLSLIFPPLRLLKLFSSSSQTFLFAFLSSSLSVAGFPFLPPCRFFLYEWNDFRKILAQRVNIEYGWPSAYFVSFFLPPSSPFPPSLPLPRRVFPFSSLLPTSVLRRNTVPSAYSGDCHQIILDNSTTNTCNSVSRAWIPANFTEASLNFNGFSRCNNLLAFHKVNNNLSLDIFHCR